ncbi:helix-turn-helix domain-containing protein [Longirhabdus pacifica]|uniref:helix-turn-helix domain-containing protein n=1 Tax=Longirhabdus pacifica TaxID=2305227 RepID=UPI0013E8CD89|nr:winged helix-turn-helix domain-containing protein [Longirhabdus pacifica]
MNPRYLSTVKEHLPSPMSILFITDVNELFHLWGQGLPITCVIWHLPQMSATAQSYVSEWMQVQPDTPMIIQLQSTSPSPIFLSLQRHHPIYVTHSLHQSIDELQHIIQPAAQSEIKLHPNLSYFPKSQQLKSHQHDVSLTMKEDAVLMYLWQHAGMYVSGDQLLYHLWDPYTTTDIVRQYIYRLRKKIQQLNMSIEVNHLIKHKKYVGYMLERHHA